MKFLLSTVLLFLIIPSFATMQTPDKLQYGFDALFIEINEYGSIIEQYYGLKHSPNYPFESTYTNCYRGHIGHYKMINNQLYLSKIQINGEDLKPTYYQPNDFQINSSATLGKSVFVDWFSGILTCSKKDAFGNIQKTYLFHFEKGILIQKTSVPWNVVLVDGLSAEWFKLYDNYHSFSYLLEDEKIIIDEKEYLLESNFYRKSPLLKNDKFGFLDWKYNWTNLNLSAAPNCKWSIENDSLYLTDLSIKYGSSILADTTYSKQIAFEDYLKFPFSKDKVFCDWVNGVYLIKQVKITLINPEDEDSFYYKIENNILVNIQDGRITLKHIIPETEDIYTHISNLENKEIRNILMNYWN